MKDVPSLILSGLLIGVGCIFYAIWWTMSNLVARPLQAVTCFFFDNASWSAGLSMTDEERIAIDKEIEREFRG